MMRMAGKDDSFTLWWWYNWYIMHTSFPFESGPVQASQMEERITDIRSRYPWIMEIIDDTAVGYALLHDCRVSGSKQCCEVEIWLNPDERRKGYGRHLLEEIEMIASLDGYAEIYAIVTEDNHDAVSFYAHHGYEYCEGYFAPEHPHRKNTLVLKKNMTDYADIIQNTDPYSIRRKNRVPLNLGD